MKYLIGISLGISIGFLLGVYAYNVANNACYMWVDLTLPHGGTGLYTISVPCGIDEAYSDRFIDYDMSNWDYLKYNYRNLTN